MSSYVVREIQRSLDRPTWQETRNAESSLRGLLSPCCEELLGRHCEEPSEGAATKQPRRATTKPGRSGPLPGPGLQQCYSGSSPAAPMTCAAIHRNSPAQIPYGILRSQKLVSIKRSTSWTDSP